MTNDNERRRVSASFRYMALAVSKRNLESEQLGSIVSLVLKNPETNVDALLALADLTKPGIERTCERVDIQSLMGGTFKGCSECSNPLGSIDCYCPSCGCKIVKEEHAD